MHAFAGGREAYLQRYLLLIYPISFAISLLSLYPYFDAWLPVYIVDEFVREPRVDCIL